MVAATVCDVCVTHFIKMVCGWVKIGEVVFSTAEDADRFEADTLARYPNDEARFDRRFIARLTEVAR